MSEPGKAVFLSYASQDAEAAKKICAALRAADIEVWFDQSELVGGDAWDQKIRKQIRECALLIPIVSKTTQGRREAYFRLEWKLAEERTHLMAKGTPFLLPVTIDETNDRDALVPDSFLAVQWTRAPGGEVPPAFPARVKKLLSGEVGAGRPRPAEHDEGVASPMQSNPRWLRPVLASAVIAIAVLAGTLILKRGREEPAVKSLPTPAAATVPGAAEVAQLRANLRPDEWTRANFDAFTPTIDRLIQTYPENGDAWALRSISHSLLVIRNLDSGTKPLEQGKAAADRAARLAPDSPLVELAAGMHLVAMISRGGDPQACRPHIDKALAGLPANENLTRYGELCSYWLGYQFEGTERVARAWIAAAPQASFPVWIMAQYSVARRQLADAEQWAERAAADKDITGVRSRVTLFEACYYLKADLAASRTALDLIPAGGRTVQRVVASRWLLAMAERRYDLALQELARTPESMLLDRVYHGPKSLLAGFTHQAAGRATVAETQFREAERQLRDELARDSDNLELRAVLALNLACLGRGDDARGELAVVEPLLSGAPASVYTGQVVALVAQTHGILGEIDAMVAALRRLFAEPSSLPFTPASLAQDPRFSAYVGKPEVQALLKEFATLDQPLDQRTEDRGQKTGVTAPIDQKSVAVLAFANRSADQANEYFSDGISEELLNVLAKVPGLKVAARASSFSFKGESATMQEIGRRLHVAHVVDGSVQKVGDQVRIRASLNRTDSGEMVWSESYTRELKDVLALEDEIARDVAGKLQLALASPSGAPRAVNPEAHRLLLQGLSLRARRTYEDLDAAEAVLTRALALDPDFAAAHAALAQVFSVRGIFRLSDGYDTPGNDLERAVAESQQALALDPTLAEAYSSLGFTYVGTRRWAEAEQLLQRAIDQNPNSSIAHLQSWGLQQARGRLDTALKEADRAVELDPLSFTGHALRSNNLVALRRFNEALTASDLAERQRPETTSQGLASRVQVLWEVGRHDEAVALARKILSKPSMDLRFEADGVAIWTLRRAGLQEEAAARAETLFKLWPPRCYLRGAVLVALGHFDEALPFLERTTPLSISRLYWNELFDPYRNDPRFAQLIAKLGCTEEYRTARETLARLQADPGK